MGGPSQRFKISVLVTREVPVFLIFWTGQNTTPPRLGESEDTRISIFFFSKTKTKTTRKASAVRLRVVGCNRGGQAAAAENLE
jgi:hypothetical protein